MSSSMRIPVSLAVTHMPELLNIDFNSGGHAIAAQIVLLPPQADDVTPSTTADDVIELKHGVTVRRSKARTGQAGVFWLGGLALKRSQPVVDGWYLRGE